MSTKKIIVLGATGSIGTSCLDIVRKNRDLFSIVALSANSNEEKLLMLGKEFQDAALVLSGCPTRYPEKIQYSGKDGLLCCISEIDADIVVNGIAGAAGLPPSVQALTTGKNLALANKETMVMAGTLIKKLAAKHSCSILPVDSEHSAIFQLLHHFSPDGKKIKEILLTASGGPFRLWKPEDISRAKVQDALQHPTWNMGKKITIDSASMANKGLEVIEAVQLFDIHPDKITVVVHPQSIVHSMIRMSDNVVYAQLSKPDMKHPIISALSWPEIISNDFEIFNFDTLQTLTFEPPRMHDFKLLPLAYAAAAQGAKYPLAYNAANEIAVAYFIENKLTFGDLASVTESVLDNDWSTPADSFDEIYESDRKARNLAKIAVEKIAGSL